MDIHVEDIGAQEDFVYGISGFHEKKCFYFFTAQLTVSKGIIAHLKCITLYSAVPNNPSKALKFR